MNGKKDFIFLHGLETRCIIGIFEWERKIRQKVLIDLEFPVDGAAAARADRIESTFNYKALAKRLLADIPKTRFRLIETLAEFIAQLCLKNFQIREIKVRVSKPGAIRSAENVGIEIIRHSPRPVNRTPSKTHRSAHA